MPCVFARLQQRCVPHRDADSLPHVPWSRPGRHNFLLARSCDLSQLPRVVILVVQNWNFLLVIDTLLISETVSPFTYSYPSTPSNFSSHH